MPFELKSKAPYSHFPKVHPVARLSSVVNSWTFHWEVIIIRRSDVGELCWAALQHVLPQCVTVRVGVHMFVVRELVKIRSTTLHPVCFVVSMVSDISMSPNRIRTNWFHYKNAVLIFFTFQCASESECDVGSQNVTECDIVSIQVEFNQQHLWYNINYHK